MNEELLVKVVMSFTSIILLICVFYIYKVFFRKNSFKDIRKKFEYKKNERVILNKIDALTKCTSHLELTSIMLDLHKALDFFELHKLTMFDRPPEKIRTSIHTYASVLLQDIYKIDNDLEVDVDIADDDELEALEEYKNDSEEEKQVRLERRKTYKEKLKKRMHLDKLHGKKDIIDYLDSQTVKKLQEMRSKKTNTAKFGV